MSNWLVRRPDDKEVYGPFTTPELAEEIKKGMFTLDNYVCERGHATWTAISQRKEITTYLSTDQKKRHKQTRDRIDASSRAEDIILAEPESLETQVRVEPETSYTEIAPAQTGPRWGLLLIVLLLCAGLGFALVYVERSMRAPQPQKNINLDANDTIRSRSKGPVQREAVEKKSGVSRFSSFDPSKAYEQSEGTLINEEQEVRRRFQPQQRRAPVKRPKRRPPPSKRPIRRDEGPAQDNADFDEEEEPLDEDLDDLADEEEDLSDDEDLDDEDDSRVRKRGAVRRSGSQAQQQRNRQRRQSRNPDDEELLDEDLPEDELQDDENQDSQELEEEN